MNWLKRLLAPKFITANCFLIDRKIQELGIDQQGQPARLLIRLASIDRIREVWDDDGDVSNKECLIYYRSSDTISIDRSYNEMYRLLKKHGYL